MACGGRWQVASGGRWQVVAGGRWWVVVEGAEGGQHLTEGDAVHTSQLHEEASIFPRRFCHMGLSQLTKSVCAHSCSTVSSLLSHISSRRQASLCHGRCTRDEMRIDLGWCGTPHLRSSKQNFGKATPLPRLLVKDGVVMLACRRCDGGQVTYVAYSIMHEAGGAADDLPCHNWDAACISTGSLKLHSAALWVGVLYTHICRNVGSK